MGTRVTLAVSLVLVALGLVLLVETALLGGGSGYVFGLLFVLAGALRLYVLRRG
jgi:hypothetical protein